MNQIRSGNGTPAAVLAGSLGAFGLLDVLGLLARTKHVGELQIVGDGVETHLWVDGGELLDRPGAAADRLFELACLDDAWFSVTATSPPDHGADDTSRVPLEPLIDHVAPQVAEWRALVRALPFGAIARMAAATPSAEVHIRAEQWRILSLIGAGRHVHEVIDVSDFRPLETLRIVHELAEEQLISIEIPSADLGEDTARGEPGHSAAARRQREPDRQREATEIELDDHDAGGPMRLVPVRGATGGPVGWRRSSSTTTTRVADPSPSSETRAQPSDERAGRRDAASTAARPAVYMPPPLAPDGWPRGGEAAERAAAGPVT